MSNFGIQAARKDRAKSNALVLYHRLQKKSRLIFRKVFYIAIYLAV